MFMHELNDRLNIVFASRLNHSVSGVHVILFLLSTVAFNALAFQTLKACNFKIIKEMSLEFNAACP